MIVLAGVRSKPGFGSFVVRPVVKCSKFWPGETSDPYKDPKSFPLGFFTHFGRTKPKNYWSIFSCDQMVLLTVVQPKPGFGPFQVRPWVKFSKFWPRDTSDLHANGPESFRPEFFTYCRRTTPENYESIF